MIYLKLLFTLVLFTVTFQTSAETQDNSHNNIEAFEINNLISSGQSSQLAEFDAETSPDKSFLISPKATITSPEDSDGAFVYFIPLELPPGIRSSTPTLGIQYNSALKYSSLGQGWNLTGLPEITRCFSSIEFDGFASPPIGGDKDALCFGSERLLLREGTHLNLGAIYRFERQPGLQIVIVSSEDDSSRIAFRLDRGDSSHQYFGLNSNSSLEYPNSNIARIWALTRNVDSYGNEIRYQYEKNVESGEIIVTKIAYGEKDDHFTRTITFNYKDEVRRTGTILNGGPKEVSKILNTIETKLEEQLVHQYIFEYTTDSSKQKQLLQSIKKCGPSSCLPPTVVSWYQDSNDGSTILDSNIITNGFHGAGNLQWLEDINGDGLVDYLAVTGDGCFHWVIKTRDGWLPRQSQCGMHGIGSEAWLLDINGDGLPDYITKTDDDKIHWNLNTGKGYENSNAFAPGQAQGGLHGIGAARWLVDINSDGLPDYVAKNDNGFIHWNLNIFRPDATDVLFGPAQTQGGVHGLGADRWLVDVNGDGLPDYVAKNDNGFIHWNLNIFRPDAADVLFGPAQNQDGVHGLGARRWLIDINGDGLPDYVAKNDDGFIHWNINNGSGWNTSKSQNGVHGLGAIQWLVDVDGDGLPDYVAKNDDGFIHWNLNLATGYDSSTAFGKSQSQLGTAGLGAARWMIDITGDGRADYVAIDGGQSVHVSSAIKGTRSGLLHQLRNSAGDIVNVEYSPLTAASENYKITVPRESSNSIEQLISTPHFVTSSITWASSSRDPLTLKYHYENARYDYINNRWLGFSKIIVKNTFNNTFNTREFRQDYPFDGLWKKDTFFTDSATIAESTATWGLSPDSSLGEYPVLEQKIKNNYTITGDFESKFTELKFYNKYAQVTSSTLDASDNIRHEITYEIDNDKSSWQLGRVKKEIETIRSADGEQKEVIKSFNRNEAGDVLKLEIQETGSKIESEKFTYSLTGEVATHIIEDRTTQTERVWSYLYDSYGFLKSRINPANHNEEYEYDPRFGLLKIYKIGARIYQNHQYDEFGRISKSIELSGNEESINYTYVPDKAIFLISKINSDGKESTETYSSSGNLLSINSKGFLGRSVIKEYQYDALGRLIIDSLPRFDDEKTLSTVYKYDALDRVIEQKYPWGAVNTTKYEKNTYSHFLNGKLLSETNFDSSGKKTEVRENGGSILLLERDPANGIRRVEIGGNFFAAYTHEGNSRIKSSFEPGRGSRSYLWNAYGEVITETTPAGHEIESIYDNFGRIVENRSGKNLRKWRYDGDINAIGNVVETKSSDGIRDQFSYDHLGRPSIVSRKIESNRYRTIKEYDSHGRIKKLTLPGSIPNLLYTYTQEGTLHSISLESTKQELWKVLDRDAQGRITRQLFGNKIISEISYEQGRKGYKTLKTFSDPNKGNLIDFEWSRNFRGNILTILDNVRNSQISLGYDELDQIESFASSQGFGNPALNSRSYSYNEYGDILNNGNLEYEYLKASKGRSLLRILEHSEAKPDPILKYEFRYDTSGNTILDKKRSYDFNEFGELRRINHINSEIECKFKRDANGEIAVKTCVSLSKLKESNPLIVEEHYLEKSYSRIFRSGYHRDQYNVYAGDQLVAILYGSVKKIDESIDTSSDFFPTKQSVLFPITDSTGTVLAIFDASGSIIAEYRYSPFGERVNLITNKKIKNHNFSLGFHGHDHDTETALIKIGHRFYEPIVGRFITPDLATDYSAAAQNTNRYSFALNNPFRFTDSSGLYIDEDGNERVGPANPDPEKHQYVDRHAFKEGWAGVSGYDKPKDGIFYYHDKKSDKVKEIYDPPIETSWFDPLDLIPFAKFSKNIFNFANKGIASKSFSSVGGEVSETIVKEGIYWFESTNGKIYVGQSKNIAERLAQHVRKNRLAPENLNKVQFKEVKGGKLMREIAEQDKIISLGGIKNTANTRNPIGPRRQHLMKEVVLP